MKLAKKKIILSLFFVLTFLNPIFAQDDNLLNPINKIENNEPKTNRNNYFNLANIVDSFLTNETKQNNRQKYWLYL